MGEEVERLKVVVDLNLLLPLLLLNRIDYCSLAVSFHQFDGKNVSLAAC